MLIERIIINSNSMDLLNYNMPSTSITGNEFFDRAKNCLYIVDEVVENEIFPKSEEN